MTTKLELKEILVSRIYFCNVGYARTSEKAAFLTIGVSKGWLMHLKMHQKSESPALNLHDVYFCI